MTGDLAVMHADGYIEIRDRYKDVTAVPDATATVPAAVVLAAHDLLDAEGGWFRFPTFASYVGVKLTAVFQAR